VGSLAPFTGAGRPVFGLVCGLPEPLRSARVMAMLQVYIDDSTEAGEVLILAGYVASAERWGAFSQKWQEQLSMRPRWRRFKMQEVAAMDSDEGWERARHHYKIIKDHVLADVRVAIPIRQLKRVAAALALPKWAADPYFIAWKTIIALMIVSNKQAGFNQPIDFYFDEQSQKGRLLDTWDHMKRRMRIRDARYVRNPPAFRSDDELMPLQAADFVAWWTRKKYLEKGSILDFEALVPWETEDANHGHIYAEHDEAAMMELLADDFAKRIGFNVSFLMEPKA